MELHEICREGNIGLLTDYLQNGGNPNIKNDGGDTILMEAARYNRLECLTLLIKYGADINTEGFCFSTALSYSAYYGHLDCVEHLLKYGANKFIGCNKVPIHSIVKDKYIQAILIS